MVLLQLYSVRKENLSIVLTDAVSWWGAVA